MPWNGLLDLPIWGYVVATLLLTHITMSAVTIFLHRHQAHRALDLHPVISHFFRFWLWFTTGMVTKEWVSIHRKHHAKCDTVDDPHSPQVLGIRKVLWQGAELYRKEAANEQTLAQYGRGTPDDWIERNVYTPHHVLGVSLLLILDVIFFGLIGISIWAVQMIWVPFWAAGVVNGIGHYWGYRNYECADASRNIFPWGILIAGEELHNNHHTYGVSAKLSSKWWEFDIGWMYIRILAILRLAKVNTISPKLRFDKTATIFDNESVKAISRSRFQIMAEFASKVTRRVNREEIDGLNNLPARNQLNRAWRLMSIDENQLTESTRKRLADILERNPRLNTVYQFKQKLQILWQRSAANQDKLMHVVQDWCTQAEQSGIDALREFAHHLKTYRLVTES